MPEVLLIGWDGAGWNSLHPLLDSGAMPHLSRLIERGVMGDLATLTPCCPPLLWTTLATGLFADRHGVLDSAEPDPVSGGVRPPTRASLKTPQIWDLLSLQGVRSQVVGWPATYAPPGTQPGSAVCVSDAFSSGVPGSISPADLAAGLEPMRFNPREWTGHELSLFVPQLNQVDQDKDKGLARLAVVLAEVVSTHAAATTLMETREWDFTAVWFGAVGRVCHLLAQASGDGDLYSEVLAGVYRFLDLLLGRLIQLAGPDAVVMLVSDRAAIEGRPLLERGRGLPGLLCAAGPGILPDELAFGASLLDVVPTILALFGFAPPAHMPGQIISEICPHAPATRALDWSANPPPGHLPHSDNRPGLEALGYTDPVGDAAQPQAKAARARRDFNLAQVLLAQGRATEAIPLLERLNAENPADLDFRLYLGHACFQAGRFADCRILSEHLLRDYPDSPLAPLTRAHLAIAEGDYAQASAHLASGQEAQGMIAVLDVAIGEAFLKVEAWDEAAAAFRSAIRTDAALPSAHEGLARAALAKHQYRAAADAALDAIRLRYNQPAAHRVLGLALQAMGRGTDAAAALAISENLRSRIPVA